LKINKKPDFVISEVRPFLQENLFLVPVVTDPSSPATDKKRMDTRLGIHSFWCARRDLKLFYQSRDKVHAVSQNGDPLTTRRPVDNGVSG
jgi:hypothetical protein